MRLHPDVERVALLGWHLYPASNRSRAGCFKGATEAASCDLDQLDRWSRAYPDCNWRVVFGPSRLWGLDVDVPPGHAHDGIVSLAALVKVHGPLPRRPQLRSGGGGLALFFRSTGEQIIGKAGNPAPGIDPRRGRQSQSIPPSRHIVTGRSYRWLVAPWELAAPVAPLWLLQLLAPPPESMPAAPQPFRERGRPYALAALRRAVAHVALAPVGSRNDALNLEAYSMARFALDGVLEPSEIAVALTHAGRQAGLLPSEIQATLRRALSGRARTR
jgi:hypothetical protein